MLFLRMLNIQDNLANRRQLQRGGKAQKFVDSECIRKMDIYTPFRTGVLKSSPTAQSKIGNGQIEQNTPYARRWYYTQANFTDAPRRGCKWFDRMKNNHRDEILQGVAKIVGGKGK